MTVTIAEDPQDEFEIIEDSYSAVVIEESGIVVVPGESIPPTAEQVRAAIDAYFADNPVTGPTPDQVAAAVAAYLTQFPPQKGDSATPEQIAASVAAYMAANPVEAIAPTQGQVQAAVTAFLQANPVPGPTTQQVTDAVNAWLAANPPKDGKPGDNATPEQIALAVANYMTANPVEPEGPTDMQVAAAVAAYLDANPPAADSEAVNALIDAYFSQDGALRESMKGAANGIATLDASGGLVQRMKIAAHSTPGIIRDAEGSGTGKSSLYPASIATSGETAVLIRTGVWQGELDYAFHVFGTGNLGVLSLNVFRIVRAGVPTYGYVNTGSVPVTITFGMDGEGYSNWAIEGEFDRAQLLVTSTAVTGGGGDPQVRDWWASATSSRPLPLGSQVVVPRVMPPA